MRPIVGITMGDAAGIGPEIIAKALSSKKIYDLCRPIVIGDAKVMKEAARIAGVSLLIKPIRSLEDAKFMHGTVDVFDLENIGTSKLKMGHVNAVAAIRDVLLSGGDPLMLPDDKIEFILERLRDIPHVEIIRIGTRVPCTFPQRVTPRMCTMLKRYHPLFVNVHFNHPREITEESTRACGLLADAGIPLGNQSVLLRGINDDPETMKALVQKLLKVRVRPYYLFQMDLVKGTYHFRTRVETGIKMIESLVGYTSGLAMPRYVIDAPGGGGKIPVPSNHVLSIDDDKVVLRNYEGKIFAYPQIPAVGEGHHIKVSPQLLRETR